MASYAIITWDSVNNRNKRRVSSTETFDFSSIKIGESGLEIKEVAGDLDFSALDFVSVGTINGVTVESHAARHESGGADAIDGDKLDITIANPGQLSEYTPTTTGTGGLATTTSQLAAHLKGIDNRLAEKLSLSGGSMTGGINMGGFVITNSGTPTADSDLVTKLYADSIAAGLDPKQSVRIATSAATGGTYSAGGAAGTGAFTDVDFTSTAIFDGLTGSAGSITIAVNDRILVKNEADAKQNGIYKVTTAGASGAMERAPDQDGTPANEVSGGNFTYVENGTLFESNGFVLQGDGTLTLNISDLVWVQFSGAGATVAGAGLSKTGNQLDVELDTTPGLEFDAAGVTGRLRVKVKASGGITRDSDGLSVNTSDITPALAGDGLVANGAALDVNVGDGTAIVSDKVVVNLATDPALEFSSGALRVKVKAAGGVTRDSNGLSVSTSDITPALAGAGLVANGAALDVNVDDSTIEINTDTLRVKDAGIVAAKLATDSVTTTKIVDANVTLAKLASLSVDENKLTASVAGAGLVGGAGSALDVNVGDGTAIVSDKVVVNLATDPALEFSSGALRVKVKADGGVTRDASGLSIDTSVIAFTLAGDGLVPSGGTLEVNAGDGIALVSDKVVVNLAIDPALEFSSGALRVKIKAASGLVRDSNGLSVNTADLTTALAGTGLVANGAALDVNVGDGIQIVSDEVRAKYTEALVNNHGSSVTVNQAVYVKANGQVALAQANVANLNSFALGVVADASIADTASGQVFIRRGAVISGFSGLNPSSKYYISRSTAGAVTDSLTGFVSGEFVYSIGRALSATEVIFDPQFEIEY